MPYMIDAKNTVILKLMMLGMVEVYGDMDLGKS